MRMLRVMIIWMLLIIPLPPASADLGAGLTGYWKLDEGAGGIVSDVSGNNNSGTLSGVNGGPDWVSDCHQGNCLAFDGVDDVVALHTTSYNSDKTFSIWFKLNSSMEKAGLFGNDSNSVIAASHPFCGGLWVNGARLIGSVYSNNNYQILTSSVLAPNVWYHAAFVRDMKNASICMYLNGSLIGTMPFTPASLGMIGTNNYCDANKLKIGYSSSNNTGGPSQYFSGQVDDVSLYSRVLTASEILDLYHQGPFLASPAAGDVSATDYYVSARDGDDTNSGTFKEPFRTIQKCSRVAQAGYTCNMRAGIYREMVTVSNSGTQGSPVTFKAFPGESVVLSGADLVTGWTKFKDSIYVADVGSIPAPGQLYVDGKFYDLAHYPNTGYLLTTASASDTTTIIDAGLTLSAEEIIGSTVIARAVPWSLSSTIATGYDPGAHTITLSGKVFDTTHFMPAHFGYYFQNKLFMLDMPGEWFFDAAAGKIYLWTENSDDPAQHRVEVSSRDFGFFINGKNDVFIQDIAIRDANKNDIYTLNSNNLQLRDLHISGGSTGIYFISLTDSSIRNNIIENTLSNGIGGFGAVNNLDIAHNTINNAGNVGKCPKNSNGGISVSGSRMNISGNTITNSGYDGIGYYGDLTVVQDNTIDHSCLVLGDCGGIYTNSAHPEWTSIIRHNKILNSFGNYDGTTDGAPMAAGIYLDDYAHGYTVTNNIVDNAYFGIFVHTGSNNSILNNYVYNSRRWAFLLNETSTGVTPGTVHGNVVSGNRFETITNDPVAVFDSRVGDTTSFGTFNDNLYCHPNSLSAVANKSIRYTLAGWQQFSGQDMGSSETRTLCPRLDTPGDVSGDGRISMYDAALVLKYTVGGMLTTAQQSQADMNGDHIIDGQDAATMAKKSLGLN